MKNIILFTILFFYLPFIYPQINQIDKNKGTSSSLIVKLKPNKKGLFKSKSNLEIQKELKTNTIVSIKKIFEYISSPKSDLNKFGLPTTDLTLIYEMSFSNELNVDKQINLLNKSGNFEYVEPRFNYIFFETPNDPQINGQYYLPIIKAFDAWNIQQGDSNIVVGITDTGIDNDHEDLIQNIYYNYDDPINGIDDDFDGFIDNFRGWDMGENDNNPQIETNPHGIRVSGVCAARTNNNLGIAGTGYRTKFLPIKITNSHDVITHGYEGMVYAAEMGCQIVNCSWGGTNFSFFGRDVVNYVALDKDVLIVAACGNSSNEDIYYPASYDYVFSVAASNSLDYIWTGSTYGVQVDITAPGESILSPGLDNTYATRSGTSYSAPIVAACAAIVKAQFPQYSGIQLGEILRKSTDIIDTIAANSAFTGKIGSGRLNLLKAVSQQISPSVVLHNLNPTDYKDNLFRPGDTISINGILTNYLSDASYVNISASCISPHILFISNIAQFGGLTSLQSHNLIDQLKFKVLQSAPVDEPIYIKLSISAGGYIHNQWIKIEINQNYINLNTNRIATTIGGNGRIGYYKSGTSIGNGFIFNNQNLIYECGLIVAASSDKVASNCRRYDDFYSIQAIASQIFMQNSDSIQQIKAFYNDINAGNHKLNIEIKQKILSWYNNDQFLIAEYTIKNTGSQNYTNLHAGIFADWDIDISSANRAGYDPNLNMGFTFNLKNSILYGAVAGLNESTYNFYAFDNTQGGEGGIDISDEFTLEERWFALTNNRLTAGNSPIGADVVQLLSSGPFALQTNDSIKLAFALIAAENQSACSNQLQLARERYKQINLITKNDPLECNVFPNPAKGNITITGLPENSNLYLFDQTGKLEKTCKTKSNFYLLKDLKPGIYILKIETKMQLINKKIIVLN